MLQVNIKKLSDDAVIPSYAKDGDAGMDITAISKSYDEYGCACYGTGLAFEIPKGYVGYLFPRSSNSKKDLFLANGVGVVDSGYRGEVLFKFKPTKGSDYEYEVGLNEYQVGDHIGQIIIMPIPEIKFNVVDELSSSDRGVGGFGSTDPITKSIQENFEV